MKVLAVAAGAVIAIATLWMSLHVLLNGYVIVPRSMWFRGLVGGLGTAAMALAWLCLGAAAVFASCMYVDPRRYSQHRSHRDSSLVIFGVLFIAAVFSGIMGRTTVGAF